MRILLVNKYWRHAGGVEVHALEVKEWLEGLGHEVIPFAMKEPDTFESEYGEAFPPEVDFRGEGARGAWQGLSRAVLSFDSRGALRAVVDDAQPDAAYVLHTYHQLGTVLLNELEQLGIPTVLSLHDYKIACPNYRLFSEATGKICTRCLDSTTAMAYAPASERCWNGSAAAGVALSVEALATRIRRSYQKPGVVAVLNDLQRRSAIHAGVDPERIVRVPHPVDLEFVPPGRRDGGFLYVGRLVPEKGVDVLIRAVAHAGVPLTIAGDGRQRADLESLAGELGAGVDFMGSVNRSRVRDLMLSARALVVPSTWHEVSPLVVYEAIGVDLPVIASAVGGMIDQLGDGRGYLVPAGDHLALSDVLRAVSSDPEAAQSRSREAREYARENWSRGAWDSNMKGLFSQVGVTL